MAALYQNPARTIILSFLLVILAGTLLLMMPLSSSEGRFNLAGDRTVYRHECHLRHRSGDGDTHDYWTTFGQVVIMLLIQIGGLGIVTFTTFFTLVGRS